jgi:hypothetical protein
MCLSRLVKDKKSWPTTVTAYKLFEGRRGRKRGIFPWITQMSIFRKRSQGFVVGRVYRDKAPGRIEFYDGTGKRGYYPKGFHAYASLKDARFEACQGDIVRKVRLSNIVAVGYQGCWSTERLLAYVGRTMTILPVRKRKRAVK